MTFWKLLRYIFFALILYGLGRYVWRHADEFQVVRNLDIWILLALWLLQLIIFGLVVASFYRIVRNLGLAASFFSWLHVYATSRLLGSFAPQAANAYRMAELKISYGFPLSSYAGALAAFILLTRLFTLFFVVTTIFLLDADLRLGGIALAPILLLGAAAISLFVLGVALFQRRYHRQIQRLLKKVKAKPTVADDVLILLRQPAVYIYVFALSLIGFVLNLVAHRLVFSEIGIKVGYAEIAVLRLSRSVLDLLPITPGNLGVGEAVYGTLSEGMVIPASAGIIASSILTLTSIAAVVTVFIIYSLRNLWRRLSRRWVPGSAAS